MSFMPNNHLHGRNLIAQYILSSRQSGAFLRYSEYAYIDKWLELGDEDSLMLVLEDLLNNLYNKPHNGHPPSLALIDKKVCSRLIQINEASSRARKTEIL